MVSLMKIIGGGLLVHTAKGLKLESDSTNKPFSFGQASQNGAAPEFTFGQQGATNSDASTSAQTSVPAFSAPTSTFNFGQTSVPAFSAPTSTFDVGQTNPNPPSSTFSFGQPNQSSSTFIGQSNPSPAPFMFGQTNPSTFTFGQSTFNFGQAAAGSSATKPRKTTKKPVVKRTRRQNKRGLDLANSADAEMSSTCPFGQTPPFTDGNDEEDPSFANFPSEMREAIEMNLAEIRALTNLIEETKPAISERSKKRIEQWESEIRNLQTENRDIINYASSEMTGCHREECPGRSPSPDMKGMFQNIPPEMMQTIAKNMQRNQELEKLIEDFVISQQVPDEAQIEQIEQWQQEIAELHEESRIIFETFLSSESENQNQSSSADSETDLKDITLGVFNYVDADKVTREVELTIQPPAECPILVFESDNWESEMELDFPIDSLMHEKNGKKYVFDFDEPIEHIGQFADWVMETESCLWKTSGEREIWKNNKFQEQTGVFGSKMSKATAGFFGMKAEGCMPCAPAPKVEMKPCCAAKTCQKTQEIQMED